MAPRFPANRLARRPASAFRSLWAVVGVLILPAIAVAARAAHDTPSSPVADAGLVAANGTLDDRQVDAHDVKSAVEAEAEDAKADAKDDVKNEEKDEGEDDGDDEDGGDDDDDDDDEGLQQRLTEREDKRRPLKPWRIDVGGRPLTIGGEYEFEIGYLRRRVLGTNVDQPDRLALEQGLEVETFYSFGEPLSIFAQMQVVSEEDLLHDTPDDVSDLFVEVGEMWLFSENIAGSHVSVDVGSLDFEDDRRWWWDDELYAVRAAYETETMEFTLAYAQEVIPRRSDRDDVEPEDDHVGRVISESSWDWRPDHAFELFALHQDDGSSGEQLGDTVPADREDESDGRLTWVGVRPTGVFDLHHRGLLGYWLDAAYVWGEERLVEYAALSPERRVVERVSRQDISGWAVDVGGSWILPFAWEPRLFAGYAYGSGDANPERGTDGTFRQTGIHANEAGFGGVERYQHYGALLTPELSNLGIVTAGAGISLLRSSSLDLVYHHYRMVEPATSLRDIRLDAELTGADRDVGNEIDLAFALEEWERVEFFFVAAAFRAGRAFGEEDGRWSYGGFIATRIAF